MCFVRYFNCGDLDWFACGLWQLKSCSCQLCRISTNPCNWKLLS